MAFCNKLSGLIRQGVSQTTGVNSSMSSSLRWMSSARLFVGESSNPLQVQSMAFSSKLGGLLRRGVSQTNGTEGHFSSMLNSVRWMSTTRPNTRELNAPITRQPSQSKPKTTKIGIVIRSFETPVMEKDLWGLPNGTKKIALPETRSLFTVLRSPHIDKKSREQFAMHIKKQYLVVHTESSELSKKFFWLKRQRIFGAQYEVKISCKTRLDKDKLKALL